MKKRLLALAIATLAGIAAATSRSEAAHGWVCAVTAGRCYYDCDTGGPGDPDTENWCYLSNHEWAN